MRIVVGNVVICVTYTNQYIKNKHKSIGIVILCALRVSSIWLLMEYALGVWLDMRCGIG
jgi:hypothetical protein